MKVLNFFLVTCLIFLASCVESNKNTKHEALKKIEFDLTRLDEDGLHGPSDGKVSISYEFCIPDNNKCKAQVKAIDRTVKFMPGSSGRIGAGKHQCLCIGSTHQKNYRQVLLDLAALPYIERIIECHFE